MAELTGLRDYLRPGVLMQFDGRCVPLRGAGSFIGADVNAWSYAGDTALRRHAVFSLKSLKARRVCPGAHADIAALVLHEETHGVMAAFAGTESASGDLAVAVEEAVTSVFELIVEYYTLAGAVPRRAQLNRVSAGHGYGHLVQALLSVCPDIGTVELCRMLKAVTLEVLADGSDASVSRTLNNMSSYTSGPAAWRRRFSVT